MILLAIYLIRLTLLLKKYFHTYSEDKNQNINQEQYAFFVLVIVGEKINMISNVV